MPPPRSAALFSRTLQLSHGTFAFHTLVSRGHGNVAIGPLRPAERCRSSNVSPRPANAPSSARMRCPGERSTSSRSWPRPNRRDVA